MQNLIFIGKHNLQIDTLLNLKIGEKNIYRSKGLIKHLLKRHHYEALKHLDDIYEIITNPNYVGINPKETGVSYEVIKQFNNNIMLGIKLDQKKDILYISTIHQISNKEIIKWLKTGRIKTYIDNTFKKE